MQIVLEINEAGNVQGLYTDKLDLFSIGKVTDVHKASNVEFNQNEQVWEVAKLGGQVLYQHKNREMAIQKEIELFSPGGQYYGKS